MLICPYHVTQSVQLTASIMSQPELIGPTIWLKIGPISGIIGQECVNQPTSLVALVQYKELPPVQISQTKI